MTQFHYHAEMLSCGHRVGLDVNRKLAGPDGTAADAQVVMPCRGCGGIERTSSPGSLELVGENLMFCETCGKGFR